MPVKLAAITVPIGQNMIANGPVAKQSATIYLVDTGCSPLLHSAVESSAASSRIMLFSTRIVANKNIDNFMICIKS